MKAAMLGKIGLDRDCRSSRTEGYGGVGEGARQFKNENKITRSGGFLRMMLGRGQKSLRNLKKEHVERERSKRHTEKNKGERKEIL